MCTHPFTGPVTCPEASVPQPTWKKNKALPPTPALTRTRSRIGLHWRPLTRLPTWTHADVRKPKSHTHPALTQTHHAGTFSCTDADTDADPHEPTRGPLPALTRTPTRTHTDWRGHRRGPTRGHLNAALRTLTGGRVKWFCCKGARPRVGPRRCPRQCGEGSPRGTAWVRVGPRRCPRQCPRQCGGRGLAWVCVGPRQCPRGCGRLGARVGPRESAWVRVSAGRKNRGADLTHTHFATTFCGKNIGPEFDTGARQALCTATVPPKRL